MVGSPVAGVEASDCSALDEPDMRDDLRLASLSSQLNSVYPYFSFKLWSREVEYGKDIFIVVKNDLFKTFAVDRDNTGRILLRSK